MTEAPKDEEVLAGLNADMEPDEACPSLDYWSEGRGAMTTDNLIDMRDRRIEHEMEREKQEFAEAMSRARAVFERRGVTS